MTYCMFKGGTENHRFRASFMTISNSSKYLLKPHLFYFTGVKMIRNGPSYKIPFLIYQFPFKIISVMKVE